MRKVASLLTVCAVAATGAVAGAATPKAKTWWEVTIVTTHDKIFAKSCAGQTYKVEKEESKDGGGYEVQKTFTKKSKARAFMKHAPGCEGSAGPTLEKDSKSK